MLNNVSSSVFTGSDSITLTPVVSAEWNHNLFNPPYITVAGSGESLYKTKTSGTVSDVTTGAKPNFTTKSFQMSNGTGSVSYTMSSGSSPAYKVITYLKTNQPVPVMVTLSGKGTKASQFGSEQVEADSLGWTKVVTYIGSSSSEDIISSFVYTITANTLSGADTNATVYFTLPEIYATTYFDYLNHSLFPTEIPFTYFRPGESYVSTGNSKYSFPSNYRKIAAKILNSETESGGFYGDKYMPISPIIQNPKFFLVSSEIPVIKNAPPTDISPYQYFVSDETSRTISAIYEKEITTNKIVIKFNTLMTDPLVNIKIFNGTTWTTITVDGLQSISTAPSLSDPNPVTAGIITLYWNGSTWTKNKWGTPENPAMPQFSSSGSLSISTTIRGISVTQISHNNKPEISTLNGIDDTETDIGSDLLRMHLIEVSPRLEIDLTDFVENVTIDKSLDSNSSALPISSINTNDSNITLSGIPAMNGSTIVPVFSSQSNQSSTILANMLRKNIKFYINFNLATYSTIAGTVASNTYIPGGVFYSDSWNENDIKNITVQSFDVSRYLQSRPVPDYVANLKSVFEVITNILDLSGFTDYDYDSLYSICNNKATPLDLSYYYCNSKDSTILDALNQIFLAYQIGAYIDEYGIMRFLSLQNILSSSTSNLSLSDSNIVEGGFSVNNDAKPGKISLRYQTPKVKQSPSLQNVTNLDIKDSPSFVYTTSNDVVWSQQTNDSVGFNYLFNDMTTTSNVMSINNNDLLDNFHTFNLNNDGYAFIENEIVSFTYKEYTISTMDESKSVTVSVKNNLELSAEIDRFIKQYSIGLLSSYATITDATGNGFYMTYTANNTFKSGQKVNITGVNPSQYNVTGIIATADSTNFVIGGTAEGSYVSGGEAVIFADYDIKITPTGNITNVQRGLFGTSPSKHERINATLASKGLSKKLFDIEAASISTAGAITSIVNDHDDDASLPSIDKIKIIDDQDKRVLIFPTSEVDTGYYTYSVKFELLDQDTSAAGLFFNMESDTSPGNMYILELQKLNTTNPKTGEAYSPARYRYIMVLSSSDLSVTYWSDVTAECNSIISNFSKIIKKTEVNGKNEYDYVTDNAFNLRLAYVLSDGSDGENATPEDPKNIVSVFLNNVAITGWQEETTNNYDPETNPGGDGWKPMEVNRLTGARQKPYLPDNIVADTKFGFCTTRLVIGIETNPPIDAWSQTVAAPAILREIHATNKPLLERSVGYFYQDREFLNGMVQNQPLYNLSPTYIMQTTPEIAGINYYDVQYTTPAAVSVDILPIEYMMKYYPGNSPEDQTKFQKKLVDEYSLSYSTPMNTGFRARMAIANARPHMVILKKDSDELNDLTNNFNLWTHEIVAPSDPEIIEQIIDPSNMSETIQLDSEWIQSKQAAYKMLKVVQMGIDGFSKIVSLKIFGNPLIQVGDIVTLSYSLNGISQQRYFVHSVSHSFSQGLETSLILKRIQE